MPLGRRFERSFARMFIAAMLSLITGLLSFLREIAPATGGIHARKRWTESVGMHASAGRLSAHSFWRVLG